MSNARISPGRKNHLREDRLEVELRNFGLRSSEAVQRFRTQPKTPNHSAPSVVWAVTTRSLGRSLGLLLRSGSGLIQPPNESRGLRR